MAIFAVMSVMLHNFPLPSLNEQNVKDWLSACALSHGANIEQLEYYFVSTEQLFVLNKTYLNHSTDTDIITFNYGTSLTVIAEVYLCHANISANALKLGQTIENETLRVVIHGLLHCIGFNDSTNKEKKNMRLEEDKWLKKFHVKHITHV